MSFHTKSIFVLFILLLFASSNFYANHSKTDSLLKALPDAKGEQRLKIRKAQRTHYVRLDAQRFLLYNKESDSFCEDSISNYKINTYSTFAYYLGLKSKTAHAKTTLLKLINECEKEKLHEVFVQWKSNHEQVDDVTIVGIKI
jgi:hypothetical protein